jgi:hypothetical protein
MSSPSVEVVDAPFLGGSFLNFVKLSGIQPARRRDKREATMNVKLNFFISLLS